MINDERNTGKRDALLRHQEHAPRELLFKSGPEERANDITPALLNAHQARSGTSNKVKLHTKKLKMTAKTLRYSGMAAYAQGQKECAINTRIGSAQWLDGAGAGIEDEN